MGGHELTDDNKVLSLRIPTEIVNRAFESLDFVDFSVLVVEDVQSILSVV